METQTTDGTRHYYERSLRAINEGTAQEKKHNHKNSDMNKSSEGSRTISQSTLHVHATEGCS